MSGGLQPMSYNVYNVGKIQKASKKRHEWIFTFKHKRFVLNVFESLKSGKFRVELNRKTVVEMIGGKRSISKTVHDMRLGKLKIDLMKITNNQYRLSVNNNTFEGDKKRTNSEFKFETFEEKERAIKRKARDNKAEQYFGNAGGVSGKDLFGNLKAKEKTGKIRLGFGKQKKKNDLFTFDTGVFGKKGKFNDKDFFGARKTKKNVGFKNKNAFANGDLFAKPKSKTKKTANFNDFGDYMDSKPKAQQKDPFDLFGDVQPAAKKQPAPKKNNNWGDFDVFGAKPKKNFEKKPAQQDFFAVNNQRNAPSNNQGGLLDFDIGIAPPGSKSRSKVRKVKENNDLLGMDVGWTGQPTPPAQQPQANVIRNILFCNFEMLNLI